MGSNDDEHVNQLARKLYWAVSSTFPQLSKYQRATTFTWAAHLAERILRTRSPSLPPPVDTSPITGYNGQAEGRGGGVDNPSIAGDISKLPPPDMEGWERLQAGLRRRAWAHVLKGRAAATELPIQLEIPEDVYRRVGWEQ